MWFEKHEHVKRAVMTYSVEIFGPLAHQILCFAAKLIETVRVSIHVEGRLCDSFGRAAKLSAQVLVVRQPHDDFCCRHYIEVWDDARARRGICSEQVGDAAGLFETYDGNAAQRAVDRNVRERIKPGAQEENVGRRINRIEIGYFVEDRNDF